MIAKIICVSVPLFAGVAGQFCAWYRRGVAAHAAAKSVREAKEFPVPIDHYQQVLASQDSMMVDEKLNRVIAAIENAFVPDRRETRLTIATISLAFIAGVVNLFWQ